jgi:hypothetical protein
LFVQFAEFHHTSNFKLTTNSTNIHQTEAPTRPSRQHEVFHAIAALESWMTSLLPHPNPLSATYLAAPPLVAILRIHYFIISTVVEQTRQG